MPNYVNQRSPWLEAANMGSGVADTLARIMITVPMLRNQQAKQEFEMGMQERELENETALVQPRINLMAAQTGAAKSQGEFDAQRTKASSRTMDVADDTGLAEFGRYMTENVPGYNPYGTSMLPNDQETVMALMEATKRMGLTRNAASSPSASASMFRPTSIASGATGVNPLGDVMVKGQQRPLLVPSGTTVRDPETLKVLAEALFPPTTNGGLTVPSALGAVTGLDARDFADANPQLAANLKMWLEGQSRQALGSNAPIDIQAEAPAQPIQVKSKEERDRLPKGTKYVGPDGKIGIKQ